MTATTTPADRVILVFGGVSAAALALGRSKTSIARWRLPASKGGTGGRVPGTMQAAVLTAAAARGLSLTAADIVG